MFFEVGLCLAEREQETDVPHGGQASWAMHRAAGVGTGSRKWREAPPSSLQHHCQDDMVTVLFPEESGTADGDYCRGG